MQCIPEAIGVPGLIFQPPVWPGSEQPGDTVWKTTAPSTSVPKGLDDPRWQGGLRIGHPQTASASEHATFRAVYSRQGGPKTLFLSWHVRVDSQPNIGEDLLWVGFERAAGDPLILKIQPFQSGATMLSGTQYVVSALTLNAGQDTATPLPSPPNWVKLRSRAWFDSASSTWAFQLRAPIDATNADLGVNLADTFRMWYEMTVVCPQNTCIPHRFPFTAAVVTEAGIPAVLHFPTLNTWESFHLSTGTADPVCPTTGFVSLGQSDIGTTNTPSSLIEPVSTNTFEAKPLNKTGSQIGASAVSASFRIANWGSIADPDAPWDAVPATDGTTNPATNTALIPDGAKGSITFKWTLNATERAKFKPPIGTGTRDRHQCVLVELSGAGLVFRPSSTWQNMDVDTASRLVRLAEINTLGLGPGPGGRPDRDTFLLVEKLNLPERIEGGEEPGGGAPGGGDDDGGGPGGPGVRGPADDGDYHRDPEELLEEAARQAMTPEERRDATMPTYRVHVYHDTGETVVRDGVTMRCLTPGTSFGFWVQHDGTPRGWGDDIEGAVRIGPNYYRLRAPAEGVAQIVTTVEAIERPRGPLGWLLWLLRLLLRLLRRLLRRQP
jgi:hypothetical protein